MLKSCGICFCFKRRKLPKPHCSLAAIRAIWWILTFCSQRHHQVPRISSLLNGTWGKPDCGVLEPSSRWTLMLTCCKPPCVAQKQRFVPSLSTRNERQWDLGWFWADWHGAWAVSIHPVHFQGCRSRAEAVPFTHLLRLEPFNNRFYGAHKAQRFIVMPTVIVYLTVLSHFMCTFEGFHTCSKYCMLFQWPSCDWWAVLHSSLKDRNFLSLRKATQLQLEGTDVPIATCLISKCSPLSALWHRGSCNQFYKWPGLICGLSYWAFYGRAAFQVFNPHSDSLSRSVIIPVYRWGGQKHKTITFLPKSHKLHI